MEPTLKPSGVWRFRTRDFGQWGKWRTGNLHDVTIHVESRTAYNVQAYELLRPEEWAPLDGPDLNAALAQRIAEAINET